MTRTQVLVLSAATVLLAGCSRPNFPGPQIQSPPPQFRFDPNSSQARNVFPERSHLRQVAWWRLGSNDTNSSIFITSYDGASTRNEVQAALDAAAARWGRVNHRYGGLERLRIDGRPAWGWLETSTLSNGNPGSIDFTAVIPYDTITFVVEISTDESEFLLPDSLRAIVGSFAIGRTEVDPAGIALGVASALVVLLVLAGRLNARADRTVGHRSTTSQMKLARIPVKAEETAEQGSRPEAPDGEPLPPP
jgi:hypothetical protein